jgi:hypothetical protein
MASGGSGNSFVRSAGIMEQTHLTTASG